jgi:hypothetical protein
MVTNPLVDVACHRVLTIFDEDGRRGVRGSIFNKVITLANARLIESKFDINLPHCWYLYGDQIVPSELSPQVAFTPRDAPIEKTMFHWTGDPPPLEAAREANASRVWETVEAIRQEFGPAPDLPELVDEVYSHAPFTFQQKFLAFRRRIWDLQAPASAMAHSVDPIRGVLEPTFEDAVAEFPDNDFPELTALERRYERVTRFGFKLGAAALPGLADTMELFWQAFCYQLRIHPHAHFNVSEDKLEYWRRVASTYLPGAAPQLTTLASRLVDEFEVKLSPWQRARVIGADWGAGTERASVEVDALAYR